MRLRERMRRAVGLMAGFQPHDDFWYEPVQRRDLAGVSVTPDSSMQSSVVAACVRFIAGNVAKLPFPIYRRLGADEREQDRNHPLADLLNHRPNGWQTAFEFRKQMTAHVAMRGNAYARIIPGPRGAVDQLIPLHPDRVEPEQRDSGDVVYEVTNRRGVKRTFPAGDIFHLRDLTLDGVVGLSRIEQARLGIGLAIAGEVYGSSYFGNGAEAAVMLSTDKAVDDPMRKRIGANWRAARRGPFNAGGVFIAEGGLRAEKLSMTNEESQFLELRGFQVEDIAARVFGIPPHLVGAQQRSTSWGTGLEQQTLGFLAFYLLDWLEMWETAAARDLIVDPATHFAEHNVDGLLRADFKSRMEGYKTAIMNGILSPDEARRRDNMNPRDDGLGGRYWRPQNMVVDGQEASTPPARSNGESRTRGNGRAAA